MVYCRLEGSFRNHPKVRKLAKALGVRRPEARGYLTALWSWTVDYAPDGDLSSFDVEDIEHEVEWEGSRGALVEALENVGLVERTEYGFAIHDWMERAESFRNASRMREARARKRAERELNNSARNPDNSEHVQHSSEQFSSRAEMFCREEREERAKENKQATPVSTEVDKPPAAVPDPVESVGPEFPVAGKSPKTWRATEAQVSNWKKAYPGVDVEAELLKAHVWILDNPKKKKTRQGMAKYLGAWMARCQNRGGSSPSAASSPNGRGPKPWGGPEVGAGKQAHRPFEEISDDEARKREALSLRAEQLAREKAAQHEAKRTKPPASVKALISELAKGKSIGGGS